jgi:hypothetical protein
MRTAVAALIVIGLTALGHAARPQDPPVAAPPFPAVAESRETGEETIQRLAKEVSALRKENAELKLRIKNAAAWLTAPLVPVGEKK